MSRPTVLVTGGAKRIGAGISRAFAEADWHVVIHYCRSAGAAEELAEELPSAEAIHCDLLDSDSAVAMIESLASRLSDWRVLVNSAAVFEPDEATGLDPKAFDRAMSINAQAPARMAQAYLGHAASAAGRRVIQLTDQKLANPNPDFFSYTMSKHAVAGTIEMLAMGAGHGGDRIYGLAPGAILPSHDQAPKEIEVSHRLNLLKRKTGVDEIARACLFLASGHLASGQTLFVDSGQHLLDQDRDVIYLARQQEEG